MGTGSTRRRWLAVLWLVVPWVARADDPPAWPEQGLELRVDAPGPWLAGVERVVVVRVLAAPTALTLAPAGGAELEISLAVDGTEQARTTGRADGQGRALLRLPVPETLGEAVVTVRARKGAAGALGSREIVVEDARVALVRTDRALYEPGEEVGIRLLVARRPDLHPRIDEDVALTVTASDGAAALDEGLRTSRFGIASTTLLLPPRARTGTYSVVARADGVALGRATFLVAHRALPRFRVELTPAVGFVAPGGAFRARVHAEYLHGPPVRDAVARILDETGVELARAVLDASGAADVALIAPGGTTSLVLRADVRAPDGTVATADARVAVDPEPLHLSLEPEGETLAPGLANRLQVVVARPDGTPVRGDVELAVANETQRATLDAEGRATVTVTVGRDALEHPDGPCSGAVGWVAGVRVAPEGAASWRVERCLVVDPSMGLLLRTESDTIARDAPLAVEVAAPAEARGVLAEAFWQGAPVARAALRRQGTARDAVWRGALSLPTGLVGPIALRAQTDGSSAEDTLSSATRVVHVRPAALAIEVEGAGEERRPRSSATLKVKVADEVGRPVQAALVVAIVDEAAERAAALPERPPADEELTGTDAVEPMDAEPWSDPEQERRVLIEETIPSIFRGVEARLSEQGVDAVGIFDDGHWRFRRELLRVLAESGQVSGALEGLGGRPLGLADLEAYDPSFRFDAVAARITRARLVALLVQLRDAALARGADLRLRPPLDLAALRRDLGMGDGDDGDGGGDDEAGEADGVVDGWGRPLFVRRAAHPRFVLSRALEGWEVGSAGPDGVVGNGDDLVDPLRASVPRTSPYGLAVGEPGGGPELSANLLASEMLDALASLVEPMGGASGQGYGSGLGGMRGRASAVPALVAGTASARGSLGASAVRDRFPKTLLWLPELVTDASGEATIPVELADSLTTWKIRLVASSLGGAIGEATQSLVVSQPLFVDVSAPPAWTAGDRVFVPVAVHNHTGADHDVVVRVDAGGALALDESPEATLHVADGGVALHRIAVRADRAGAGTLRVSATSPGASDAAERTVRVLPAAREATSGHSSVLEGDARVAVDVPGTALPGTASLQVRVHGGFASVAIDGLESLLREPNGCFEQTSSATYPNILVLDHLGRSGHGSPEVLARARKLVDDGYARLRAYEVRGGGFSWFGEAPANLVLTAYGLREFADMAAVRPVDAPLLARTQEFLLRAQRSDGSWSEPSAGIPEGVTNLIATRDQRTTAYVLWSLAHAGVPRARLRTAAAWLRGHAVATSDRYGLALSALALAAYDAADETGRTRLRQLVGGPGRGALKLEAGSEEGLMHGGGDALDVELSALAALAAAKSGAPAAARLGAGLVEARRGAGGWGTTQATVLSLQALLALTGMRTVTTPIDVAVELDGRAVGTAHLRPDGGTGAAVVAVPALATGHHEVRLRCLTPGAPALVFDAVAHYDEAWPHRPVEQGLAIGVQLARDALQLDEVRTAHVRIQNGSDAKVDMLMARIGIPTGFEADTRSLVALQERGLISMVEDAGRTVDVYLPALERGATLDLPLRLVARQAGRVAVPASTVYAYYDPELQGTSPPFALTVVRP